MSQPKYLTVKQFAQEHSWPSEPALRSYIFRAEEYGLSDAFSRVGRRVLVDPEAFFRLLKENSDKQTKRQEPTWKNQNI